MNKRAVQHILLPIAPSLDEEGNLLLRASSIILHVHRQAECMQVEVQTLA